MSALRSHTIDDQNCNGYGRSGTVSVVEVRCRKKAASNLITTSIMKGSEESHLQSSESAECWPRLPNEQERIELADFLILNTGIEHEIALEWMSRACIAVFDDYVTDGPGYAGKVMSVVWSGSPTFFDLFTWQAGKLKQNVRELQE